MCLLLSPKNRIEDRAFVVSTDPITMQKAPEVREVEVEVVREVEKKVEYRGTPMLSSALKDLLVERDGTYV